MSPGHMKYHTPPLVMLGIGVWASCPSQARTILVYLASMKSTVTYTKHHCIVSVFGSPGLLPSCPGPCVIASLLLKCTSCCWRMSPLFVCGPRQVATTNKKLAHKQKFGTQGCGGQN